MGSKSRQPAARLADIGSGHGCFPPTPIITGSGDVTCNGRPVARVGDMVLPHGCSKCSPHPRSIAEGAGSVMVNGKAWARVSDAINCGGKVSVGSGNVLVGDQPKNRNPVEPAEWDDYVSKLQAADRPRTPYQRTALAAATAIKFRGAEGAIATWHEHYARQIGREEPLPPIQNIKNPAERLGLQRAQQEHAAEQETTAAYQPSAKATEEEPEPWPDYVPPAGFGAAFERLNASEARINKYGYQPRYSDDELVAMAEQPVDDSLIVRVMEMDYIHADDGDQLLTGKLGGPLAGTQGIKYWTTTFKHVEDADHDTRKLVEKMGVPYDPNKRYVMVMVDREKAAAAMGSESFVPTFENLGAFAAEKFPDELPEQRVAAVMNKKYQEEYKRLLADSESSAPAGKKFNVWRQSGLDEYAAAKGLAPKEKKQFQDRLLMDQTFGANSDFRGDGITKERDESVGKQLGAIETFTYDDDPKTLQTLLDNAIAHVHALPYKA